MTARPLSKGEETLALHIKGYKLPKPEREFRFHPKRRWRFDFAWPNELIAVEVEGVSHGKSRHQTIAGYAEDCVKYNEAAILGWRVLRFTQGHVSSGLAIEVIMRGLEAKKKGEQ